MASSCNSIPKFISHEKRHSINAKGIIQSLKLPIHGSKFHFRAYASSREFKRKQYRREVGEEEYEFNTTTSRQSKRKQDRRQLREAYEDFETQERRHSEMKERPREKKRRSLITVSPAGERWESKWDTNYVLTLSELELDYLAADGEHETEVKIFLTCQLHAGFGLSVHGRVVTSFNSECSWCSKLFYKEIETTFDVTVLPEPRESCLTELGGDDSVIYVKYGSEAGLDSFIQDKIMVKALSQDVCSKSCGDTPIVLFSEEKEDIVPRWPQLLRLKEALLEKEAQLDVEKGPDSKSG